MFFKKKATIIITILSIISSTAEIYYLYRLHLINFLYTSSLNLNLARQTIDSSSKNIPFIGIYSPLQHILLLPFIWNKYLWHTGYASIIISIVAYTIANVYIYKSIKLFTRSYSSPLIGVIIFALNPNILFLEGQTSPELLFFTFSILIFFYLYKFFKEKNKIYLFLISLFSALASITLSAGIIFIIVISGIFILKYTIFQKNLKKLEGTLITFLFIAILGEFYTVIYSLVTYGHIILTPLYNGFSYIHSNSIWVYGMSVKTISTYLSSLKNILGVTLPIASIVSVIFLYLSPKKRNMYTLLFFLLTPAMYYVTLLLIGNIKIQITNGVIIDRIYISSFFILFESVTIGVFLGVIQDIRSKKLNSLKKDITYLSFFLVLVVYVYMIYQGPYIQRNKTLINTNNQYTKSAENFINKENINKGRILIDLSDTSQLVNLSNINLSEIVDENNIGIWEKALKNPGKYVKYIVISKTQSNPLLSIVYKHYRIIFNNKEYKILEKV